LGSSELGSGVGVGSSELGSGVGVGSTELGSGVGVGTSEPGCAGAVVLPDPGCGCDLPKPGRILLGGCPSVPGVTAPAPWVGTAAGITGA